MAVLVDIVFMPLEDNRWLCTSLGFGQSLDRDLMNGPQFSLLCSGSSEWLAQTGVTSLGQACVHTCTGRGGLCHESGELTVCACRDGGDKTIEGAATGAGAGAGVAAGVAAGVVGGGGAGVGTGVEAADVPGLVTAGVVGFTPGGGVVGAGAAGTAGGVAGAGGAGGLMQTITTAPPGPDPFCVPLVVHFSGGGLPDLVPVLF